MNKFKKNIKQILWTLPFICFLIGYYLTSFFLSTGQIEVPNVIGKNLQEATKIISDHNLNVRIVAHREDPDLPDGTIVDQNPFRQKIKPNKPVYITVSRKFRDTKLPDFKGQDINEIQKNLKRSGLKCKIYFLENLAKENSCISQYPEAGKSIDKNEKIILYISSGNKKPIIVPNFKRLNLKDVINFLNLNEIKYDIIVNDIKKYDPTKDYIIIDQRPIAGTILQLNKKLNFQLQVQE